MKIQNASRVWKGCLIRKLFPIREMVSPTEYSFVVWLLSVVEVIEVTENINKK